MEAKTCEECVDYVLCKKATAKSEDNHLCGRFVDAFEVEEIEDVIEVEEDETIKLYLCNGIKVGTCDGCPHAVAHEIIVYSDSDVDNCLTDRECEDVGKVVKCEEVKSM